MTCPDTMRLGNDPRAWTDAFMSGPVSRASFPDMDSWLAFTSDARNWFAAALAQRPDSGNQPYSGGAEKAGNVIHGELSDGR